SGIAMISVLFTVHDGVRLLCKSTYGAILKMKDTFSTTSNFIRLGTQEIYPNGSINAINNRGAASGTITVLAPTVYRAGAFTTRCRRRSSPLPRPSADDRCFLRYPSCCA